MSTVIVGTGIGGIRAAQSLRSEGYSEPIYLVGEETGRFYDRPPLSKSYLAGSIDAGSNTIFSEEESSALDVELVRGSPATGVDLVSSQLTLAGGRTLPYESLIIATGARALVPRPLASPYLHTLRTLEDADRLRSNLRVGGSVAIIGAGFVGAETAATLQQQGYMVTLIDTQQLPMQRSLDERVGRWFYDYHSQQGVRMMMGVTVDRLTGGPSGVELEISDGTTLSVDTVLAGLGAVPNTEWLTDSGVPIDNGILTDGFCRIDGAPNAYAIGDVSRWYSHRLGRSLRLEHWTNAVDQAAFVARRIAGTNLSDHFDSVPYVWTDQYDWKMQIIGHVGSARHLAIGDPLSSTRAAVVYGDEEQPVAGAIVLNWPRAMLHCRRGYATQLSMTDLHELLQA